MEDDGMHVPVWTEEEEELVLPQTVIEDLVGDIQDQEDDEMDVDFEPVLQDGLEDSLDSDPDAEWLTENTKKTELIWLILGHKNLKIIQLQSKNTYNKCNCDLNSNI